MARTPQNASDRGAEFEGGDHEVVTHSAGEYARGEGYDRHSESRFALDGKHAA